MVTDKADELIKEKIGRERQNSFLFRRSGTATEIKIYFDDVKDLKEQLLNLEKEMDEINKTIKTIQEKSVE